jgi:hypothetical protein
VYPSVEQKANTSVFKIFTGEILHWCSRSPPTSLSEACILTTLRALWCDYAYVQLKTVIAHNSIRHFASLSHTWNEIWYNFRRSGVRVSRPRRQDSTYQSGLRAMNHINFIFNSVHISFVEFFVTVQFRIYYFSVLLSKMLGIKI